MAAAVMSDAAVSAGRQKEHLVLEGVRGERPTMAEDHGRSAAPVLVINLRAVLGRHRAHGSSPLLRRCMFLSLDSVYSLKPSATAVRRRRRETGSGRAH